MTMKLKHADLVSCSSRLRGEYRRFLCGTGGLGL